jgi:hypothetical protein
MDVCKIAPGCYQSPRWMIAAAISWSGRRTGANTLHFLDKVVEEMPSLCRRHGISDATFYTWRSMYGGLEVSEMRRLRQLEEKNGRLKSIVADQALDLRAARARSGPVPFAAPAAQGQTGSPGRV